MTRSRITAPSAGMHTEPDEKSGRETDALFGEEVEILSEKEGWAEIILATDGYRAWVQGSNLGALPPATHHVVAPRALVTAAPDIKSPAAGYFPMGSRVTAGGDAGGGMMQVEAPGGRTGYIIAGHALPLGEHVGDFVSAAENLIGTPYRWGGRDSLGIDCSALVQLSMAAAGMASPRNSGDQEKTIGDTIEAREDLGRGDLVFWKGHVGIMRDAETLLHANMWHGMAASENLDGALPRLEKAAGPVTRMARPGPA